MLMVLPLAVSLQQLDLGNIFLHTRSPSDFSAIATRGRHICTIFGSLFEHFDPSLITCRGEYIRTLFDTVFEHFNPGFTFLEFALHITQLDIRDRLNIQHIFLNFTNVLSQLFKLLHLLHSDILKIHMDLPFLVRSLVFGEIWIALQDVLENKRIELYFDWIDKGNFFYIL